MCCAYRSAAILLLFFVCASDEVLAHEGKDRFIDFVMKGNRNTRYIFYLIFYCYENNADHFLISYARTIFRLICIQITLKKNSG